MGIAVCLALSRPCIYRELPPPGPRCPVVRNGPAVAMASTYRLPDTTDPFFSLVIGFIATWRVLVLPGAILRNPGGELVICKMSSIRSPGPEVTPRSKVSSSPGRPS